MSYIQPTSQVWLCANVPLDPSYDNQMTFTSGSGASRVWDESAQRAYFASKAVYHPTNFSIVKERDGVLRMSGEVSNYYNINYMYFVNPPFATGIPTRYFYAFVTQIEYINPNTTFIYFELDEFQTWAKDIVWMESSIEREHVEHDEMYANLEDEGIEVNDLVPYQEVYLDDALGKKILVVGATESYTQMLEKIQNEGLNIDYNPYSLDYPVYHSHALGRMSETIDSLQLFSNSQIVNYNSAYYDKSTNRIIIYGVSTVDIDTMYFNLRVYSVATDWTYYVKAVRNANYLYDFSIDGIRIMYNAQTYYPEFPVETIFDIKNLKAFVNNSEVRVSKYTYDNLHYDLVIGGVSDTVDKIKFDVVLTNRRETSYHVLGTKTNNVWNFVQDGS